MTTFFVGFIIISGVKMSKKQKEQLIYDKDASITALAIDSHAHLDRNLNINRIVSEMAKDGIKKIVMMAGDVATAKWASETASKYNNIYYMFGLHPYDIKNYNEIYINTITKLRAEDPKLVGLGEIGLDYKDRENMEPKNIQCDIFIKQLQLAHELKLPVSIHIRDAHDDARQILKENKHLIKNSGIIHCCSATVDEVRDYLELGLYISFSGSITYGKKNQKYYLEDTLKAVPLNKLLIETDCPFLCPAPYRGQTNEPKFVLVTATKVAEILGIDVNDVINITTKNAETLLKI